jgi:hypothetical protein
MFLIQFETFKVETDTTSYPSNPSQLTYLFQRITIKTCKRKKIKLNLFEVGEIIDSETVKPKEGQKYLIKQKSIKRMVSNMKRARLTLCLFI